MGHERTFPLAIGRTRGDASLLFSPSNGAHILSGPRYGKPCCSSATMRYYNQATGVHCSHCRAARFATAFAGAGDTSSGWHPPPDEGPCPAKLLDGLRDRGWIDGRNLIIESRYAPPTQNHLLPKLGCGAGRSRPRSAHRHRPTSSRSPEFGNRYHSDCIRACGRSRRARPRPKPSASRRQHNGPCDSGTGVDRLTARNATGNCSYRLKNCGLGPSGQSNTQADNSRGAAPNWPRH